MSGEFSERPFRWDMYVSSLEGGLIDACLMLWPRASRFAPEVTRYVASCDQYGKISSNYNPQEDESLDLLQTRFFHQKNHLTYFKHKILWLGQPDLPLPPKVPGTPHSGNHGFSSPTQSSTEVMQAVEAEEAMILLDLAPWKSWPYECCHESSVFFFKWDVVGLVCGSVMYSSIYICYILYIDVCVYVFLRKKLNSMSKVTFFPLDIADIR